MRAFSTLRIFPFRGRIAWKRLSLPCFAEPPAESPSTRYISHCSGSVIEQSASLPGSALDSSADFLRTSSRALRAASRACADCIAFSIIFFATGGFSSRNSASLCPTDADTSPAISLLPSLPFVCPSNCGSGSLTLTTAVMPSRTSSPESVVLVLLFLKRLFFVA